VSHCRAILYPSVLLGPVHFTAGLLEYRSQDIRAPLNHLNAAKAIWLDAPGRRRSGKVGWGVGMAKPTCSKYGSSLGNWSSSAWRMPRCCDDLILLLSLTCVGLGAAGRRVRIHSLHPPLAATIREFARMVCPPHQLQIS